MISAARVSAAFLLVCCCAWPACAADRPPLERGTAIIDPLALRELDHGRFGLTRIMMPDNWNGRYFDQVNGGNDGAVVPAYGGLGGNQPDNALARGYAVLSSDSGHDGQANRDAGLVGGNLFGFDEQARLDYGYTANVTLTPLAKTIIERYYGRRPEYSSPHGHETENDISDSCVAMRSSRKSRASSG